MALISFRAILVAVLMAACLSGCREKSVLKRNAASQQALAQIGALDHAVAAPELPGPPEPPPGVGRAVILETPADRFMAGVAGLPDEMRPPLPEGVPPPPEMPGPPQSFTRLFEPPRGLDASPVLREIEVMRDLKLVKEREVPRLAEASPE